MYKSRNILNPESLSLLLSIEREGSFAGAARAEGIVPSALTYRVRQIEEALDVLLFDRSSRNAKPTPAGLALLREAERLLVETDGVANRIKRIATGWESQFTIAIDGVLNSGPLLELCEQFFLLKAPTRLRLKKEVLSGTLETLVSGQADLALGVGGDHNIAHLLTRPIGEMRFPFVVAKTHPLASAPEPLGDDVLRQTRAIAVADSVKQGPSLTFGLLQGQEVFTVATLHDKLQAQLHGLGAGFLPEHMVKPYLETGQLVEKTVDRERGNVRLHYAWRAPVGAGNGRALQWWLSQLQSERTLSALLSVSRS
jgi:DNA-binding transcriptional LysR family regulator